MFDNRVPPTSTVGKVTLLSSSLVHRNDSGAALRMDFALSSGGQIETALLDLPYRRPRLVVCAPSQVGCVFGCKFCGLRETKRARQLTSVEIIHLIDQSLALAPSAFGTYAERCPYQISFMGQGEPLANMPNLLRAMKRYMASRRLVCFGISTLGIPSRLHSLADAPGHLLARIKLQLSLHAALDPIRHSLMPGTKGGGIRDMLEVAKTVSERSGRQVCLNYLLLEGINDGNECLEALKRLADPDFFYVKLSVLNEVKETGLTPSGPEVFKWFAETLESAGCVVKIFRSAGRSVNAGCGQVGPFARPVSVEESCYVHWMADQSSFHA